MEKHKLFYTTCNFPLSSVYLSSKNTNIKYTLRFMSSCEYQPIRTTIFQKQNR